MLGVTDLTKRYGSGAAPGPFSMESASISAKAKTLGSSDATVPASRR